MEKRILFATPYPSTAVIQGPTLIDDDSGLLVAMSCDDEGHEKFIRLRFIKPRAFRKREQTYCTSWHVKDTFDTVCEIDKSDWIEELRSDAMPEWRDQWIMRHFMVYFDNFGCLEVAAESAELVGDKNSTGT